MTFFYDLNARLNSIAAKPVQRQLNEGAKPDFLDLDRDGNKTEPMKKAAGSARKSDMDESALQAYLGKKKYGEQGMKALQKAGRDGVSKQKMDAIRNKHDKMDEGEVAPEHNRAKKVDVPAFQRKATGGDWKTTQKDLDKDRERNISDRKGLARLRGADPDTVDEGWDDMIKDVDRRRGQMKPGEKIQGHKGEIERTTTGIRHTRRYDDKTGETDVGDGEGQPQKKGRGRPKGTGKSIGAKGPSGKSKLMTKEGADYGQAQQIYDDLAEIRATAKQAQRGGEFPQGFASRLESVLYAAMTLIKNQQAGGAQVREEEIDEKAVSKKQQKFMGMVHATQKGEKAPSKEVAKVAKSMPKKEAEKFASTKHKGLPEKVGKKKTEESADEAPKATGSKGGMQFGKGIYDSFNRELEQMIAESMNVSMNMSTDPQGGPTKSLTVTATDEDAVYLGKLLKMAGMGGEGGCGCGTSPCSCDQMEEAYGDTEATENAPDYPTNTEINDDVMQYAGGINKPKSTGQTTVPVIASQTDRQVTDEDDAMGRTGDDITLGEEDALARLREMAGIAQEERTEEGNLFTGNLAKARADGKKEADLDGDGDMEKVKESIFDLTNQWRAYKG
jgi:hypothetical protein